MKQLWAGSYLAVSSQRLSAHTVGNWLDRSLVIDCAYLRINLFLYERKHEVTAACGLLSPAGVASFIFEGRALYYTERVENNEHLIIPGKNRRCVELTLNLCDDVGANEKYAKAVGAAIREVGWRVKENSSSNLIAHSAICLHV